MKAQLEMQKKEKEKLKNKLKQEEESYVKAERKVLQDWKAEEELQNKKYE